MNLISSPKCWLVAFLYFYNGCKSNREWDQPGILSYLPSPLVEIERNRILEKVSSLGISITVSPRSSEIFHLNAWNDYLNGSSNRSRPFNHCSNKIYRRLVSTRKVTFLKHFVRRWNYTFIFLWIYVFWKLCKYIYISIFPSGIHLSNGREIEKFNG